MFYSIILGIVQGITEFLPVSSSAHLIIVSWLMSGQSLSLDLNVAFHFGTLLAVLTYFFKDWMSILQGGLARVCKGKKSFESQLLVYLILGSVPVGILGLLTKDFIEEKLHHPLYTVIPLIVVGFLLWQADKKSSQHKAFKQIEMKDALLIGLAQVCALFPGVSRSGSTILAARLCGIKRTDAARFSFLLGTPPIAGASLLHLKDFISSMHDPVFISGVMTSWLVGMLVIRFFIAFLARFDFLAFFIYRSVLAVAVFFVASYLS